MRISRLSGCDDGAHRYSVRGIHQLLSGLAETLATVYWLRRELLRRGQEALVVRLNFVLFTDSASELYGQRMYIFIYIICKNLSLQVPRRSNTVVYNLHTNQYHISSSIRGITTHTCLQTDITHTQYCILIFLWITPVQFTHHRENSPCPLY
jgi:hypothetical protein